MRLRSALIALIAIALISCVTPPSSKKDDIKLDINELKATTLQLKAELDELKAQTAQQPKPVADEALKGMRESQASMYMKIEDMHKEMQALENRLDARSQGTEKNISKVASEVDVLKANTDSGGKAAAAPSSAEVASLKERITSLEAEVAGLKARQTTEAAHVAPKKPAISADAAYKAAYAPFEKKKYAEARSKMNEFLKNYPNDKLAGNAQFWVAESYYNEKEYRDSVLAYEEVIQKYPTSPKVPAALWKQAHAFIQIGDRISAKANLKTIVDKHPKSAEAANAAKKLKTLK